MHYYKRNLGDYAKKAGRLTMLQHGSYTLLIDACYDREQFPTRDEAIDWTWASATAEIEAVDFVLSKFFVLEDGRYVQTRIREELNEYREKATNNQRIAIERETKRKQNSTERAPVVHEAPPNHKPLTINQEPKGESKRASRIPPNFEPEPEPEAEAGIDRPRELANFRDYWTAKARDNTKLSWQATWRQWARKADRPGVNRFAKPAPNTTVPGKTGPDPELLKLERDAQQARPAPAWVQEFKSRLKQGATA